MEVHVIDMAFHLSFDKYSIFYFVSTDEKLASATKNPYPNNNVSASDGLVLIQMAWFV